MSVGRDVTKSKAAQQTLERNEALLRTVVQNLPNGAVLLFDMDLRYLMADGEQLLASMGLTTAGSDRENAVRRRAARARRAGRESLPQDAAR